MDARVYEPHVPPSYVTPSHATTGACLMVDKTQLDSRALIFGSDYYLHSESERHAAIHMARALPVHVGFTFLDGSVCFANKKGVRLITHKDQVNSPVCAEFVDRDIKPIVETLLASVPKGIRHITAPFVAISSASSEDIAAFMQFVKSSENVLELVLAQHDRALPAWLQMPPEIMAAIDPVLAIWLPAETCTRFLFRNSHDYPEYAIVWRPVLKISLYS